MSPDKTVMLAIKWKKDKKKLINEIGFRGSTPIKTVESVRILGFFLDMNGGMQTHINVVKNKMRRSYYLCSAPDNF